MRYRFLVFLVFLIVVVLPNEVAMADEPTKPSEMAKLEERIAELEKEKELLEKEKELVEAARALEQAKAGPTVTARETQELTERIALIAEQKKMLDELTPELPQGLAGTITLDDNQSIEAQIAAYETLGVVASQIANRISPAKDASGKSTDMTLSRTVLVTPDDVGAITALLLFEEEANALKKELKTHAPETVELGAESLLLIEPLLKTAADVAALFRTDTVFKARTIAIADEALVAAVAGRLPGVRLYPQAFAGTEWSLGVLTEVDKEFTEAGKRHLKQISVENPDEISLKRIAGLTADWERLEPKYRAFRDALRARDPETGITPLSVLNKAAWLRTELARNPRVVMLKVLHAGGTYVLKKRFWRGATLSQSGGLVAQFMVFDTAGQLMDGGTFQQIRTFDDLNVAHAAGAKR